MMLSVDKFIHHFSDTFATYKDWLPWEITSKLSLILHEMITQLDDNYQIENGIAIHASAIIDRNVILKPPVIVSEGCFIGANAYLRGGVYLGKKVVIGTGCEIKTSLIMAESSVAHFNFIGDSLIGSHVNFEAGSITANHYNERTDKQIRVVFNHRVIDTGSEKFGALVGDHSKIGANAVLSPGTILARNTIVRRLELVEQYSGR